MSYSAVTTTSSTQDPGVKSCSASTFTERISFVHGFYANTKLLAKYAETVGILLRNHCSPDDLLLKLRKTGDKLRVEEKCIRRTTSLRMNKQPNEEQCLELAVVEGDLEVIGIKCGRKPS